MTIADRLTTGLALLTLLVSNAHAAPVATVRSLGLSSAGNLQWLVEIDPDESLFSGNPLGGSLAVELALSAQGGDVSSIMTNNGGWPAVNPGNNPFTGTITDGLWTGQQAGRDVLFISLGSAYVTTADLLELVRFETLGYSPTTVRWGQAAAGTPVFGTIIAQAGQPFSGQSGPLSAGVATLPDLNLDGIVDIFDVNLVSSNWGGTGPLGDANGDGTVNVFDINLISAYWGARRRPGDVNNDGAVNIFDVNLVSAHWGGLGPAGDANNDGIVNIFDVNVISSNWDAPGAGESAASVPEPSARMLLGIALNCAAMYTMFGILVRRFSLRRIPTRSCGMSPPTENERLHSIETFTI